MVRESAAAARSIKVAQVWEAQVVLVAPVVRVVRVARECIVRGKARGCRSCCSC